MWTFLSDSVYQNLHISIQRRPSILRTIGKVIFSKFNIYFHFPKLDISISPETLSPCSFPQKLNLGRERRRDPCVLCLQRGGRYARLWPSEIWPVSLWGMIATLPKIKHIFLARNHGLRFLKAPLPPPQFKLSSFQSQHTTSLMPEKGYQ